MKNNESHLHFTGADITKEDNEGHASLFWACWTGHLAAAQYLVEAGAVLDHGDRTPLMGAAQGGRLNIIKWLLAQGMGTTTVLLYRVYHYIAWFIVMYIM